MYEFAKRILFQFDAENVHRATMEALDATPHFVTRRWRIRSHALGLRVFGVDFPNPIGLAAGFDKNGRHADRLFDFGFGHVEIGTVTGEAQPGNPRPRLFRLPDDRAILNRMGFNNDGAVAVASYLAVNRPDGVLGINIGKTKTVSNEEAHRDYEKSFRLLHAFGDYFVVNVSSPNTPGLRTLQDREPLSRLLNHLQKTNQEIAVRRQTQTKPILLKIAPDLTDEDLQDVVDVVMQEGLDGLVATNTTLSRDGLRSANVEALGAGGISGAPVHSRSVEVVARLRGMTDLPIVGVGGVFTASDAMDMFHAGADLVQIWTGFVYGGPDTVRTIHSGLLAAGWSPRRTMEAPAAT